MKTIGLIGGMSWESTAVYYRLLNEMARERLGGLHSAEMVLWSFDFAGIEAMQSADDWVSATEAMLVAARNVARAGAQCILICANTMHRMAAEVEAETGIPLIHIADAAAAAVKTRGTAKPLLLGTRFTMEGDFYRGRLETKHGLEVLIPNEEDRTSVHDVIYHELCQGMVLPESKRTYRKIIEKAIDQGADGVIMGCTEICLLIDQADFQVPVFDTTRLHAAAAMDFALS